ncbi:MAG: aminotransferase class I/II-fold pyridoxal phosphate-dependent enzyme [Actinomycetota bacterium]|nr:aminotransferase class I/II-fold pyridoxal phosphate-dependent enzyme [Actinomycetota bacterium]
MVEPHPFDQITADDLRAAGGMKWTRFGPDHLGAFVAEMDFGAAPPITEALHGAVDRASFGYTAPAWREAMVEACAAWQRDAYGWEVPTERIHALPDVLTGLSVAIELYCKPDAPVILPTAAYMPFLSIPGILGRETIEVPMVRDGDRWVYDLDGLDAAYRAGGDLLILCNPHNPLGRVMTREEMVAIAEVVDRHGGRVFSDEIHSPLTYPGHDHVPYASISETTAAHTVTATSASKAWNLPGLKCAQLLFSNDADAERWEDGGWWLGHGASSLGIIANAAAYAEGKAWLDDVLGYLDGNRKLLGELLADHLPEVGYTPPEGTYLSWLDCRALDLGMPAGEFFDTHAKVALVDGLRCGPAGEGFARLNFATPRPILREIVDRMAKAVHTARAAA